MALPIQMQNKTYRYYPKLKMIENRQATQPECTTTEGQKRHGGPARSKKQRKATIWSDELRRVAEIWISIAQDIGKLYQIACHMQLAFYCSQLRGRTTSKRRLPCTVEHVAPKSATCAYFQIRFPVSRKYNCSSSIGKTTDLESSKMGQRIILPILVGK